MQQDEMSSFPEWLRPWLDNKGEQITHGLNLVLELRAPAELPLMLLDILLAQNKIKQALETLSFVHFARFIPSWDGRALMVTTEFDGPLDPYVLDFVIALGDVFDTLLSYVKTPPKKMPVRQFPDEFLEWVREWNRVPFAPRTPLTMFPAAFDYPIYSAYPGKTVTDIAGARPLPPPALDHPGAEVNPADVQGNILRGYRARHGRYLLYCVKDPDLARDWLAKVLPDASRPWRGVADSTPWPLPRPETFTQVAFTYEGMELLLPPDRQPGLALFPKAFQEGPAKRAFCNFDRDSSAPTEWIFGGESDHVHVVIFVYTMEEAAPNAFLKAVQALESAPPQAFMWLRTLVGEWQGGKEPFGFADGISDPVISGQCPGKEAAFQPAASPGEFLLHQDYASIYGGKSLGEMPQELAGNGSFGVLRLMEQHKELFLDSTEKEAKRLGVKPDMLRAKMVGRWTDGTPLSLAPNSPGSPGAVNAFDYGPTWEFPNQVDDHTGLRCPVGAHIRRAYPRTARVAGQPNSRRLLRRGMASSWKDGAEDKVGLMGLFMGASIEHQFEFIQRQWLHGDSAASGIRGTKDAISSIRSEPTDFPFLVPDPMCPQAPHQLVAHIPPLVRTRGCLYLFFPGISALKSLNDPQSAKAVTKGVEAVAEKTSQLATEVTRTGVNAVLQAVQNAASGVAQTASAVASSSAAAVGDAFESLGVIAGSIAEGGQAAVAQVAQSVPAVQTTLPVVGVTPLTIVHEWKDLLEDAELQPLADGKWNEIIEALVNRAHDSDLVKEMVESFAPSPVDVGPPGGVPLADFDFDDPQFRANPFAVLHQLREVQKKSIVWVPAQQACWVIDQASCEDLLLRNKDFVQVPAGTPLRGIVTLDHPRHGTMRTAYLAAFGTALARTKADIGTTVEQFVKGLLQQVHRRQFDFMHDFAHPTARAVVWDFIGIRDRAEQRACDALAQTLVLQYGKSARPDAAGRIMAGDAGLRLAAHLAKPLSLAWLGGSWLSEFSGTLIGELAARMAPGVPIPHPRPLGFLETLITLVQTVLASQSPHYLLSSAALHLMLPDRRPGKGNTTPWAELAALKGKPFDAALALALDEARRFEPPLTMVERYANGQQSICGVTVPSGCAVFAMVASANRDTTVYGVDAEVFMMNRSATAKGNLTLGRGAHECAGQALQADLVPTALGAIIQAMPDLRLSNPTATPAWQSTVYFRVLQALSVTRCPP